MARAHSFAPNCKSSNASEILRQHWAFQPVPWTYLDVTSWHLSSPRAPKTSLRFWVKSVVNDGGCDGGFLQPRSQKFRAHPQRRINSEVSTISSDLIGQDYTTKISKESSFDHFMIPWYSLESSIFSYIFEACLRSAAPKGCTGTTPPGNPLEKTIPTPAGYIMLYIYIRYHSIS